MTLIRSSNSKFLMIFIYFYNKNITFCIFLINYKWNQSCRWPTILNMKVVPPFYTMHNKSAFVYSLKNSAGLLSGVVLNFCFNQFALVDFLEVMLTVKFFYSTCDTISHKGYTFEKFYSNYKYWINANYDNSYNYSFYSALQILKLV